MRKRMLFTGNSYTFFYDVPGTFKSLAESGGKEVYVDFYATGGATLYSHYNDPNVRSIINSKQWNYVVLQEQSQQPAVNPGYTLFDAKSMIYDLIKQNNPCTEPIIFMTWARDEGNAWLMQINWTHAEMAAYYEGYYESIWKGTNGIPVRVSPVGKAFHEAKKRGISVYDIDKSHQNQAGTYLAACAFYSTIFKESPIGLQFTTEDAMKTVAIQQVAHDVVMTNLYEHNINKVRIQPSVESIEQGATIDFEERIWMHPFPNSFTWSFEGAEPTLSNAENPTNISYNTAGTFDVTLEISDECGYTESRTFTDTVQVSPITGLPETSSSMSIIDLKLSNTSFSIAKNMENASFYIYDTNGKEIPFEKKGLVISILDNISNGYYFLLAEKDGITYSELVSIIK